MHNSKLTLESLSCLTCTGPCLFFPCLQRGYTMHDRVLRAAEVGVVKAPSS
jgi:hypothetical protein